MQEIEPKYFDIRKDVVDPILDELWDEILRNQITVINRLDFLPANLGSRPGRHGGLKNRLSESFQQCCQAWR